MGSLQIFEDPCGSLQIFKDPQRSCKDFHQGSPELLYGLCGCPVLVINLLARLIITVLIRLQADLGYKPRPQTSHFSP